jgi:peptidoglycan/LPS O-acetylase OafA/YrhL
MVLERALERPENNILLIRFTAATLVVFSHSFPLAFGTGVAEPPAPLIPTSFGTIGVSVFFVISGLLISRSYAERRQIWRFLWARVLRIYPALVVAVLFCAAVVGPLFTSLPVSDYLWRSATASFVTRNASHVPDDSDHPARRL